MAAVRQGFHRRFRRAYAQRYARFIGFAGSEFITIFAIPSFMQVDGGGLFPKQDSRGRTPRARTRAHRVSASFVRADQTNPVLSSCDDTLLFDAHTAGFGNRENCCLVAMCEFVRDRRRVWQCDQMISMASGIDARTPGPTTQSHANRDTALAAATVLTGFACRAFSLFSGRPHLPK